MASIPIGFPQDALGVGDIGYRLAVFGEGDTLGGNAPEKRSELFALRVEARSLAPAGMALSEDFGSIPAYNWSAPTDGARGQLNWLGGRPAKQPAPLIESPDLAALRDRCPPPTCDRFSGQENEESPIRSPLAATPRGRGAPAGQELMEPRSVRLHLIDFVVLVEPDRAAVRRPGDPTVEPK